MTDRSKTVVMLIDWDNLQICHNRDAPGTDIDLNALIALAQSYGTLVTARAYAEWNIQSERLAVYKSGIEPVFAPVMRPEGSPREGKSLADTVMVADGVDLLWTVAPDVFVLVTSDKDMIPLARIAKQRGAAVVVLGSDLTAIQLVEMSNVFISYRQLLRELDRTNELDAPSGRAPARERRRLSEARRPTSEPVAGRTGHRPRELVRPSVEVDQPTLPAPAPARSGPAAPSTPALASAPAAAPGPVPETEPSGDGVETVDGVSPESPGRRRRRRGGRSRGRGTAAAGLPTDGREEPGGVEDPSAPAPEHPDQDVVDQSREVSAESATADAGPSEAPTDRVIPIGPTRSPALNAPRPVFRDFGATTGPLTSQPGPDAVTETVATPDTVLPGAATPRDASDAAPVESLATPVEASSTPAEPPAALVEAEPDHPPVVEATPPAPEAHDAPPPPEATAASDPGPVEPAPPAEDAPKPVRRRRTRSPRPTTS